MLSVLASIILTDIVPIFCLVGAGFLLARYGRTETRTVSLITLDVLAPCLVFTALTQSHIEAVALGQMIGFSVLSTLAACLVAWVTMIIIRPGRGTAAGFILAATFTNCGNYGLPLIQFAFGQEALAFGTIFFVVNITLVYTLGVILAAGGQGVRGLRRLLVNVLKVPVVYAVSLAGLATLAHVTLPAALLQPVGLLGNAALPCMLLVLGMQLREARIERPLLLGLGAGLRLVAGPVIAVPIALALGLHGAALQAGIVQAAAPSAVISVVLAAEYGVAPALVTGIIFVSTLASPLTLAVIVALLQR